MKSLHLITPAYCKASKYPNDRLDYIVIKDGWANAANHLSFVRLAVDTVIGFDPGRDFAIRSRDWKTANIYKAATIVIEGDKLIALDKKGSVIGKAQMLIIDEHSGEFRDGGRGMQPLDLDAVLSDKDLCMDYVHLDMNLLNAVSAATGETNLRMEIRGRLTYYQVYIPFDYGHAVVGGILSHKR